MTSFVVLSHDDEPGAQLAEKTVFVRDAASLVAFAVPVLWLMWHRLWLAAILVLCASIAILLLWQWPSLWVPAFLLSIVLGILVATEGPAWRMKSFALRGYKQRGVVEAETHSDAQLIWSMEQMDEPDESPPVKTMPKPQGGNPARSDADNLIFTQSGPA